LPAKGFESHLVMICWNETKNKIIIIETGLNQLSEKGIKKQLPILKQTPLFVPDQHPGLCSFYNNSLKEISSTAGDKEKKDSHFP